MNAVRLQPRDNTGHEWLSQMYGAPWDVVAALAGVSRPRVYALMDRWVQVGAVHVGRVASGGPAGREGPRWVWPTRETAWSFLGWIRGRGHRGRRRRRICGRPRSCGCGCAGPTPTSRRGCPSGCYVTGPGARCGEQVPAYSRWLVHRCGWGSVGGGGRAVAQDRRGSVGVGGACRYRGGTRQRPGRGRVLHSRRRGAPRCGDRPRHPDRRRGTRPGQSLSTSGDLDEILVDRAVS